MGSHASRMTSIADRNDAGKRGTGHRFVLPGGHPVATIILKGWNQSAQGCEERATLGLPPRTPATLKGLYQIVRPVPAVVSSNSSAVRVEGAKMHPRSHKSAVSEPGLVFETWSFSG